MITPPLLVIRPGCHPDRSAWGVLGATENLWRGVEGSRGSFPDHTPQGVLSANYPACHHPRETPTLGKLANRGSRVTTCSCRCRPVAAAVWGERLEAVWRRTHRRDPSTPRQRLLKQKSPEWRSGRDDRCKRRIKVREFSSEHCEWHSAFGRRYIMSCHNARARLA